MRKHINTSFECKLVLDVVEPLYHKLMGYKFLSCISVKDRKKATSLILRRTQIGIKHYQIW